MNSLDFMILGAQKAGTTALASFLGQHSEIELAVNKEVHLFDAPDYDSCQSAASINERYAEYFTGSASDVLRGESTPIYIYWPEIAAELKRYNSNLKIIVILRDPVERAYSHYLMNVNRGDESLSFLQALWGERRRINSGAPRLLGSSSRDHSYVSRGLYAEQLENLLQHFPRQQILVIENNALLKEHSATLARVFSFLGVDIGVSPAPKIVFSRDKSTNMPAIARLLLRVRFWAANRELKKLLLSMGYQPNWSWLV